MDIDQHQRQPQLYPLFNFMILFCYTSTAQPINLCACNEDYDTKNGLGSTDFIVITDTNMNRNIG